MVVYIADIACTAYASWSIRGFRIDGYGLGRCDLVPECVANGSGGGPVFVFRFWECVRRSRTFTTVICAIHCALRIGLDGGRLGRA